MSVTSEVFQYEMLPYRAAATAWSLHQLFTLNCIVVLQGYALVEPPAVLPNIIVIVVEDGTSQQSCMLKAEAERNMYPMVVTLDTALTPRCRVDRVIGFIW